MIDYYANREKTITKIFEYVIAGIVIVCFIGMVYCCITFTLIMRTTNSEYRKVLKEVASSVATTNASDGASDSSFSNTSDQNEKINSLITHMESMIAIQTDSTTNNLMSFIYGIISTLLVGLCAGFVVKCRENADEAKKTADKAKNNAEKAKGQADRVSVNAKEMEKLIVKAQNSAKEASKSAENAATIVTGLKYQVRLLTISSRIVSAKLVLLDQKVVLANIAISQVKNEIVSLFSDDVFVKNLSNNDNVEIEKVYGELTDLKENVNTFSEMCRNKYRGDALVTMENAASNYHKWIDIALEYMDNAS